MENTSFKKNPYATKYIDYNPTKNIYVERKSPVLISIENVSLSFKKNEVLSNISFDIHKGDRIALVGSNGAGKTTLIETILGLNKPSKGKIIYKYEYKKSPMEIVGVQFQDSNNPSNLSTNDIIKFFANQTPRYEKKRIDELIKRLKIKDFLDHDAMSLSGGQKQKLNVILSMINKPEIIFLDELTTGLDIPSKATILKEIGEYLLDPSKTMILITHNEAEILNLANRIIIMEKGKYIYDRSVKDTLKTYKTIPNFFKKFVNITD